jgi:Phage integrase, N-terminal SAM-like domain
MRPHFDANGRRYHGVSQASFENYARDVRRIQKYLGDIRLDQLRVPHVRGMLVRMANAGETPENQRTTLVRLGTILNMAEGNGDIVKNVAAAFPPGWGTDRPVQKGINLIIYYNDADFDVSSGVTANKPRG